MSRMSYIQWGITLIAVGYAIGFSPLSDAKIVMLTAGILTIFYNVMIYLIEIFELEDNGKS